MEAAAKMKLIRTKGIKTDPLLHRPKRMGLAFFLVLAWVGCGMVLPLAAEDHSAAFVSGIVTAEDIGRPIVNALVRVSSPGIDMRSVRDQRPGVYDGRTDANGRFKIEVPKSGKISINVLAPGYQEAAGAWGWWTHGNGTYNDMLFPTSNEPGIKIKLDPAMYVAGIVTDESGHPFPGARIEATITGPRFGMCYLAFDTSEADGRFEIFDYPLKLEPIFGDTNLEGRLTLRDPNKLTCIVENIYALPKAERTNLHVTLRAGHVIKGKVTSADGKPATHTAVEAIPADENAAQRTTWTDGEGRFEMSGLPDGEVRVQAHAPLFEQKAQESIRLAEADAEVNLALKAVIYESPAKPVSLLGMKLADATPDLQAVYNLDSSNGVVILDPGTNFLRLEIGGLTPGDCFWIAGDRVIKNLKELVTELLRVDAIPAPGDPNEGCHGSIRVVYEYRNRAGTMTQRLKLTDADRAELENFLRVSTP